MGTPEMQLAMGRREFLGVAAACTASGLCARSASAENGEIKYELSLVESSLSRSFAEKTFEHLEFARVAKNEFEIDAIEYATEFFPENPPSDKLLDEMNKRAAEYGVRQLLIAVAGDVRIAAQDSSQRDQAVKTASLWIDVAKSLGCHSIQINPTSSGEAPAQQQRAIEALAGLCRYAAVRKINVLLGNYGGASANAAWIAGVINAVESPFCRAIPRIKDLQENADYDNLARLAPLAKGMTADTSRFDEHGNECTTNYARAMQTIHDADYRGYVGINYQGQELEENAGIRATKMLLEHVRKHRS